MFYVLYITLGYFILGAIATQLANRGKEKKIKKERWVKIAVYFIIVHFILLVLLFRPSWFIYIALFIVITGFYEIIKTGRHKGRTIAVIFALIIYLLISSGFLSVCTYISPEGLIQVFLMVFIFDGFSQIAGQLFGKRKLLPKVSPGKTGEGFAGGFIATLLTAIFLLMRDTSRVDVLISTCLICFAALCGDLLASLYKRKMGVKDFSKLIPGHGGVLDRFDSLIAAGCAIFVYLFVVLSILFNNIKL